MILTLEIPDTLAAELTQTGDDLARTVLEDFAAEAYRQCRLSAFDVRQLLGHSSRWETENFLASHGAWPGTTEDELIDGLHSLETLPAPAVP